VGSPRFSCSTTRLSQEMTQANRHTHTGSRQKERQARGSARHREVLVSSESLDELDLGDFAVSISVDGLPRGHSPVTQHFVFPPIPVDPPCPLRCGARAPASALRDTPRTWNVARISSGVKLTYFILSALAPKSPRHRLDNDGRKQMA